jgi:DNA-binding NarL/FixJ family response regulator
MTETNRDVAGVLLLDGHWITKTALGMALAAADGLKILNEVADPGEAAEALAAGPVPDVVVFTEANDPTIVINRIAEAAPGWPIRALMIGGNGIPAALSLRCASTGSLPWATGEQEFVSAVRLVAAGHSISARPRDDDVPGQPPGRIDMAHDSTLTTRECDVLLLLAKGYTNAEISTGLGLGESTVKSHVQNLLNKLGARNRVSAAIYAYETGLMRPDGPVRFTA